MVPAYWVRNTKPPTMRIVQMMARGIDLRGFAVSSPSETDDSTPTNRSAANMNARRKLPEYSDPGLNTSRVFPFAPPLAMMTTAVMRNGITETMKIVSCVRTDTVMPTTLIAVTIARKTMDSSHHGTSRPRCSEKNIDARNPEPMSIVGPPRMRIAR
ncbi:unannotated protein [freshwater metagenome]|uniref:Unannotated protein n=1 Tax=freshwater metagenome TaxID=449393 RepID=A0A6J7I6P2_9ZZZZ